ncbi:MAG: T9SS type A sorting domain-containing protein [Flavobacteriales bacterium]|nr:T9SS type A sorting domain-containing protein [Flavobacteriales bacterium]
MKSLLLAPAVLLGFYAHAQSWCPPGAIWTFNYADHTFGGGQGVTRVVYEGDTTVGGFVAQKLRVTDVIAPWGSTDYTSSTYPTPILTRYAEGIVYMWDEWPGAFDTLMWFSASPGQYWTAPGIGDDPGHQMLVLDTSTVLIGGLSLRQLIVQRGLWNLMPPDTLRERIGFSFNFLDGWTWFVTDMPWAGLRCYSDDQVTFTDANVTDCGFTLRINERLPGSTLSLFPNPGTDHFNLSVPPGPHLIRVFDAAGREVLMNRVNGPSALIRTGLLSNGMYAIRVDREPPVRWIKQ